MNAKSLFLKMACVVPEGMEAANDPDKYAVSFLTSAGFIEGTISKEFLEVFGKLEQELAEDLGTPITDSSITNSGEIIALDNVLITQSTGITIELPSLAIFTDQIIGVTFAQPLYHSKI